MIQLLTLQDQVFQRPNQASNPLSQQVKSVKLHGIINTLSVTFN